MKRLFVAAITLSALLTAGLALSVNRVEVVALFKNKAVIRVAEGEGLIKVGETTSQGVTLISADAKQAHVRYLGEEYHLTLSSRIGVSFEPPGKSQVDIVPDRLGQYRVRGFINNRFANFLVDTGASLVALSSKDARELGLNYDRGEKGRVQTAQGTTDSYFMILDEVMVGGITAYNVRAAVIEGEYPVDILLGMSFLRQVGMREQGGVLTLTQKN
ncbi:MAG: retropepsin-like aspartic protease [Gammaproteobacteria bacterium]|nr:retropepsin-like aspartic protease [Gammaproteobacteria bacterium]